MRRFITRSGLAIGIFTAAACAGTIRVEQALQPDVRDLAAVSAVDVIDAATGKVLLSGTFSEAATDGAQVERTATLTSPANSASKGLAKIEIERSGGLSDEQVQVELENMPYPASCRLKLDGYAVVMFSPPADGKVRLKLNRRVTPATRTVAR